MKELNNCDDSLHLLLKTGLYRKIRQLNFGQDSKTRSFNVIVFNESSIWLTIIKIFISFLSVIDIFLDILLIYQFFHSGHTFYAICTIIILIVVGLINVVFEWQFLRKSPIPVDYLPGRLNFTILRYFCTFWQLSAFLITLKATIASVKAKKQQRLVHLLNCLFQINSGHFYYRCQLFKYIETYLEAIPQIALQVYIILVTKQCSKT